MGDNRRSVSWEFAQFIEKLCYGELPQDVIQEAKRRILDCIASAYAGRRVNKTFNKAVCEIFNRMGGTPSSTVLFSDQKLPAANAAFLNAAYVHGADLDDGHKTAMGHPGVTVIPPVFALAEARKSRVEDMIVAIAAGYETYVRVSNAVMPSLFSRGFHGTGVCGAISAGCACAKLLGYDAAGIHRALSFSAPLLIMQGQRHS